MGDFFMKAKYSIIFGLLTSFVGFIPLSFSNNKQITYCIYADSIINANMIKNELLSFYKENCFSSSYEEINSKINLNFHMFNYEYTYIDNNISIYYKTNQIKMKGYLYKETPSTINFKSYFTSVASSIPEATSINVATSALSDQI